MISAGGLPFSVIAAFALLAAVVVVLFFLFIAGLRQPVMARLGMRNIPRRPTQSILIVVGLTLSTVIIVSALTIGDTLNRSVQWHAIKSYGAIDEIIAPPLLGVIAQLAGGGEGSITGEPAGETAGATGGATAGSAASALGGETAAGQLNLGNAGLENMLQLFNQGLPGIDTTAYEKLRDKVAAEPLADGIAPSILFPTIIRNTTTGQGVPFGFIMAVDDEYTTSFGLHSVDGQAVTIERLRPGVGNIFVLASRLFGWANQTSSQLGFGELKVSDVATAIAGLGATLSEAGGANGAGANGAGANGQGFAMSPLPGSTGAITSTAAVSSTTAITPTTAVGAPTAVTATTGVTGTTAITATTAVSSTGGFSLAGLNLGTLSSEIDRVLGQAGLQLREGEVYLSRMGAEQLDARPGDRLEVFLGPIALPYRVVGIVDEAGPVSALAPVVVMRLDEAQELLFMQGRINNVLVSNAGDAAAGLKHTAAMTERLRVLSLDDALVEQIAGYLRTPEIRPLLEKAIAERGKPDASAASVGATETVTPATGFAQLLLGSFIPQNRLPQNLAELRAGLDETGSDRIRQVLADAEVRSWLAGLPVPAGEREQWQGWLNDVSPMDVLVALNKASVVAISGVLGTVFSSIFTIFGIFSILAGVLLIFLIFVMLATERRSELGMARAIGVQRRHLVQSFVTEGMLYDLVAAGLGLALGLLVSFGMVGFIGGLFNTASGSVTGRPANIFEFRFSAATTSVVIGYCLGVLFTFLVVLISSWRVSRLNIVTAIRDLPDEAEARPLRGGRRAWQWAAGLLWLAAAALLYFVAGRSNFTVSLICATLALVGLTTLLARGLERTGARGPRIGWARYSLLGLGLIVLWGVPWDQLTGRPDAAALFQTGPAYLLSFVLAPTCLILGMILLLMFNADAIAWLATRIFGGIGWLAPVLRTAIAYPLSTRFRTGMVMVMFAMVVCTVTVMAVVIEATRSLVVLDEKASAGFQIEAKAGLLSFFDPITDLQARIATQAAAHPLLAQITAVGSVATQEANARTPGMGAPDTGPADVPAPDVPAPDVGAWGSAELTGVDAGYVAQARKVYAMQARADGYADDAAVWDALAGGGDVAVVTPELLARAGRAPTEVTDSTGGGQAANDGFGGLKLFRPGPVAIEAGRLPETYIEVRLNPEAATTQRLRIIGVLGENITVAGGSIQVPLAALRRITGKEVTPGRFYLQVAPDADVHAVSQEVERTFLGSGLDSTVMAESFAQGQALTRGILRLFQGFMALGLLVGIAALGVIASRTVVERRQQVGVMRALGFHPGMVAFSFVVESSFVALAGIVIGTIAGVLLGEQMVRSFFSVLTPETTVAVPWVQLGVILLLAYGFSLLLTLIPALQASRIYPAEALRYE